MSNSPHADSATASAVSESTDASKVHRLRTNAVGTVGVIFMAVATAAPITAMVGNVPVAVGQGNGIGAPAGYLVATIVLGLFALGYATMAKHITATGAFFGFISHGMGRVLGMASGCIITLAYVVFEPALIGIFSFFATQLMAAVGLNISWIVFAVIMLVLNSVLTFYDVNLTAKVLGFFLVAEIIMLAVGAFAVLFSGGGPEGFSFEPINPINAFTPASGIAGASAGLGLFFAFWSWVGFESTAMYGEESRNPKKIIPRATMVAVLGVGVFYVFVSWMGIVGTGPTHAIELAQNPDTASEIFFGPVREHIGSWAVAVFNVLLCTGSFACGLAFHNCASRYIYALAREGLSPLLQRTLGATHKKHKSPHVASITQTIVAGIIILVAFLSGMDPYGELYVVLAILGTMAILVVQALCAFSVVSYFHIGKNHPESAHWFKTFLAPLLGGIGMLYVVVLMWMHKDDAAGAAADTLLFKAAPWIVVGFFVLGGLIALYFKYRDPVKYELIGRIVLDDERS